MKIIQEYLNEANIFKDILSDVRKKGKDLIQKLSKKAAIELEKDIRKSLTEKGLIISNLKLSLGKFRGSYFVTSCKLSVKPKGRIFKTDTQAETREVANQIDRKMLELFPASWDALTEEEDND